MITKFFLKKGIAYKSFKSSDNGFDLFRWLRNQLDKLHVVRFDDCCDSASTNLPVRYNQTDNVIESFDGTTWNALSILGPSLAAPTALAATPSVNNISVAFTAVTHATNYVVQRATNSGFTTGVVTFTGTTSPINVTGLTTATAYFIRIKSQASGYTDSAWSTTLTSTTL